MSDGFSFPAEDTVAYNLLALTAISGELPTTQIPRLPGGEAYKESVVTGLKNQGLIRTYYRDGLRGLRLTIKAKKHLALSNPERFGFCLSGQNDTSHIKGDPARRLRLHRISETSVTMQNSGITIFRDEKPPVFSPSLNEELVLHITEPTFYNSREIKEIGLTFVKIKGARSVGVLISAEEIFIVYNLGNSLIRWEYKSEMRTRALMKTVLCRERLPEYSGEDIKGLIFADDMELCFEILANIAGKQYYILDGNYENFYFLTNDYRGERILSMLVNKSIEERLINILESDLLEKDSSLTIENDAFQEDGTPVLFSFYCDMPRIKRFETALAIREINGVIICFDFQAPALEKYCGEHIRFKTIDFDKWERSFFER